MARWLFPKDTPRRTGLLHQQSEGQLGFYNSRPDPKTNKNVSFDLASRPRTELTQLGYCQAFTNPTASAPKPTYRLRMMTDSKD
jgi:hypothetical protein